MCTGARLCWHRMLWLAIGAILEHAWWTLPQFFVRILALRFLACRYYELYHRLQFRDHVDWQRSQNMLEEVVRLWVHIDPQSLEFHQIQALLLESLEAGRQSCEAAALTAQILVMGFRQPAAVEVQKLLVLPDAFAGHQPSWAANWFLSLPDPAVLVLSGWYVFFAALLDALKQGLRFQNGCEWLDGYGDFLHPLKHHAEQFQDFRGSLQALALLQTAASMQFRGPVWQQAVGFRVLKDRLRSAFEMLRDERRRLLGQDTCLGILATMVAQLSSHVAFNLKEMRWTSVLDRWPDLPTPLRYRTGRPFQAAVCIAGQPRVMSGELLLPVARQLFGSLCPVAGGSSTPLKLFFMLASQPHLGLDRANATSMRSQLEEALRSTLCPRLGPLPAMLRQVELLDDASHEDIEGLVNAYPEDAWWHGEGHGRLKWVRQLQGLARCQSALEEEESASGRLDWVVFLRPDLLHVVPLPDLSLLPQNRMLLVPDGGQRLTPQAGYLEGLDRALILSRKVAEVFFVLPLHALKNASFVANYPTCLHCPGWRSPGVKLSPEKHLANVLWQWAEDHLETQLELTVDPEWIQPLVLSERGCINFRPCADRSCLPIAGTESVHAPSEGPRLPRWARQLTLQHTCWPMDAEGEAVAKAWVDAAPADDQDSPLRSPSMLLFPQLSEQEL
ncbi:Pepd [Symbiodinium natans]|uniref:Pepd protein n=1 Tax=Symbiodinium natans TaxID=878477 RepID=A0A812JTD0_9DINO|nr:Pepd [Symbiodinium natans]